MVQAPSASASFNMLLTGLQPYREKPSKDRAKRFVTAKLLFDKETPNSDNIRKYQY